MAVMLKQKVKFSEINPLILYNEQIEKIKAAEYLVGNSPQAIKYQILDSESRNP